MSHEIINLDSYPANAYVTKVSITHRGDATAMHSIRFRAEAHAVALSDSTPDVSPATRQALVARALGQVRLAFGEALEAMHPGTFQQHPVDDDAAAAWVVAGPATIAGFTNDAAAPLSAAELAERITTIMNASNVIEARIITARL